MKTGAGRSDAIMSVSCGTCPPGCSPSGWYRKVRYFDSDGRQFREHLGSHSYWFFKTAEENQPWMASQWHEVAAEVTRKWSA